MCCCGKPTINGEKGYRWQPNDQPIVRPVDPPDTGDHEVIFDEPGRCGGLDSHSHHYRIAGSGCFVNLYCRNGSGDTVLRLSNPEATIEALRALDSNGRYWILNSMYHAALYAARDAESEASQRWITAAIEKRIKVRRRNKRQYVKILPKP